MPKALCCRGIWSGRGSEVRSGVELGLRGERIESLVPAAVGRGHGYLIPAFVDAHWHMSWAGLEDTSLMLDRPRSRAELLAIVRDAAAANRGVPNAAVLRGEKLDESSWADPALPSLAELDEATGDRPVFLRRVCGHLALVNSALMRLLPAAIVEQARATGILREQPVLDFDRLMPARASELRAALERAAARALREGVTGLCTMEPLRSARELSHADCPLEVRAAVFADDLAELEAACGAGAPRRAPWLFGVKIFLDGAIGARTAALAGGYLDGSEPSLLYDDEAFADLLVRTWRLELTPVVHAIGARALEQLARVSQAARRGQPNATRLGVRVEHAEELGAVPAGLWDASFHRISMQPNFVRRWQGPGGLYEQRLARDVARRLNPFATVMALGLPLGFGSDGMPFGPRWGVAGATEHPLAEQRLPRATALAAYTLDAAAMSGLPELARPIEVGRRADFVLLSEDPLRVRELDEAAVLAVFVRGRVVWEA